LNISSFGEDEQGELYVVGLGGAVSKIVSASHVYDLHEAGQPHGARFGRAVHRPATQPQWIVDDCWHDVRHQSVALG
jgi:hypothetical protein